MGISFVTVACPDVFERFGGCRCGADYFIGGIHRVAGVYSGISGWQYAPDDYGKCHPGGFIGAGSVEARSLYAGIADGDERAGYDSLQFRLSETESAFRAEIEERERFNLGVGLENQPNHEYYHFFPPVEGVVTQHLNENERHYGTDIVAKANAKVAAVMDGVVVFTDWTVKTGYVIQIQHANDFLSVYKHNSTLLKKQGDHVRAGEVIAIVGNTGEETTGPHLHFELWRAGNPLNPEDFIQFK